MTFLMLLPGYSLSHHVQYFCHSLSLRALHPSFEFWVDAFRFSAYSQSSICSFTNTAAFNLSPGICHRIIFHWLPLESPSSSQRPAVKIFATISVGHSTITDNGSHFLGSHSESGWWIRSIMVAIREHTVLLIKSKMYYVYQKLPKI